MRFELLSERHAQALLAFEESNQAWFERTIEAREPAFYSLQGVHEHIDEYVQRYHEGMIYPLLIINEQGELMGRANLRRSLNDPRYGFVGYRVGEAYCGQGVASAALKQLIRAGYEQMRLDHLRAFASVSNIASQRVLEKQSFLRCRYVPQHAVTRQGQLDAWEFVHFASLWRRHWHRWFTLTPD
ncbi:GNAT family N-acetyltransferase [Pokkaliibacter plantistimulans]|uniref:GNAT family N-acetyltransferase n=1 Tax=Pokkaliibacter plantistimulans TaxID=1635171 RepID=UPI000D74EC84|nr:GNAT family N-acetyltransferase [Pokkaliibacter plantistimulans]